MKNVVVGRGFNHSAQVFSISPRQARLAVTSPDRSEPIQIQNEHTPLAVLYLKRFDTEFPRRTLLIMTSVRPNGDEEVAEGWPVPASVLQAADSPIHILEEICDRFGLHMRVGPLEGKFFLDASFESALSSQDVTVTEKGSGEPVETIVLIKPSSPGVFQVAIAYTIDPGLLKRGLAER